MTDLVLFDLSFYLIQHKLIFKFCSVASQSIMVLYRIRKKQSIELMHLNLTAKFLFLCVLFLVPPAQAFDFSKLNPFAPKTVATDHIPNPIYYQVGINMPKSDSALVKKIEQQSLLLNSTDIPVAGGISLISKAKSEFENLIGILYSEAYYGGVVDMAINSIPISQLKPTQDFDPKKRAIISVSIRPGEKFRLAKATIDSSPLSIDPKLYNLYRNGNAGSELILDAEQQIVADLRAQGRPLAKVIKSDVSADHSTNRLDVTIKVDPHKKASFGSTTVLGAENIDPDFARYMLDIQKGEVFNPTEIGKGLRRLRGLDVFNSASISEADILSKNNQLPLTLALSERKPRVIGAGTEYSTTDGIALKNYWRHRNLFGQAEKLSFESEVSRITKAESWDTLNYLAQLSFDKPGFLHPDAAYGAALRVKQTVDEAATGNDIRQSRLVELTNQFTRKFDEQRDISLGVGLEYTEEVSNNNTTTYLVASLPSTLRWDYRNSKLNPSQGWQAKASIEPGYEVRSEKPYLKIDGEASHYFALDVKKSWVIASRIAVGSFALGGETLPTKKRFYAGGGGSVRGYSYQRIGPKDSQDLPTGGLSLLESSLELRKQITEKFQIVPFIDAGVVSNERLPTVDDIRYGAGLGLRYLTPIGPLRLDVAAPINRDDNEDSYAIYAGIGQAF
jgi:translocation and assembly module TamA